MFSEPRYVYMLKLSSQTDRKIDRYFIDRNKSHYRLICHSNKRDICTCIYKNVSLLVVFRYVHDFYFFK